MTQWPPDPPKRMRMLRGYLRNPGFHGVWLSRKEVKELLVYFEKLGAGQQGQEANNG